MKELKDKISVVSEKVKRKPQPIEIERGLERLSYLLDGLFHVPGTGWRFGLDALIGLIPGVGDTITSFAGFYILAAGVRYRVPKVTLLRMGLNIGIDYVFGIIPVIGDLFDAVWKSNEMNIELLRKRATVSADEAKKGRKSDWIFVGLIILILIGLFIGSIFLALYVLKVVVNGFLGLWK
ncbi:MAG: hypothetical protein QOJ02_2240 [Acidobacteriota bacterium]|jgi:hypothetical protein|nr:hypothetical protein [Acidobacteriota bacterium]